MKGEEETIRRHASFSYVIKEDEEQAHEAQKSLYPPRPSTLKRDGLSSLKHASEADKIRIKALGEGMCNH